LNVFNTKTAKGEETRERIFASALALFRTHGFDRTTMRDVAAAADMSLGAAYHYFPSKEAIVLAYYAQVQDEHARRVAAALNGATGLRERVAAVMHTKFDILAADRPLMGALLRYTGDPSHPLSFLGEGTRQLRLDSVALFASALSREKLPEDLQRLVPETLWALHMGLLLYFLYDTSPKQHRTRTLADGAVALFVRSLSLAKLPILKPFRRGIVSLLDEAGLLPAAEAK
jgi:AcrR family transcriptional regulator